MVTRPLAAFTLGQPPHPSSLAKRGRGTARSAVEGALASSQALAIAARVCVNGPVGGVRGLCVGPSQPLPAERTSASSRPRLWAAAKNPQIRELCTRHRNPRVTATRVTAIPRFPKVSRRNSTCYRGPPHRPQRARAGRAPGQVRRLATRW